MIDGVDSVTEAEIAAWPADPGWDEALAHARSAAEIYTSLGASVDAAHADWLVARLTAATDEAIDRLKSAATRFQRAGRRESSHYQAVLKELSELMAVDPADLSDSILNRPSYAKDGGRRRAPRASAGPATPPASLTQRRLGGMGYFTKPDGSLLSIEVAPLSNERIQACLDAHDWHYRIDSDGDIGGWWDGHWFYFFVRGAEREILFVQGRWDRGIPAGQIDPLVHHVNDWNSDHLWPKLAAIEREDSAIVLASFGVNYSHGLTDAQLDEHVRGAIAMSIEAFNWLDEQYPVEAAAARENE
jgi:hypothetical protein